MDSARLRGRGVSNPRTIPSITERCSRNDLLYRFVRLLLLACSIAAVSTARHLHCRSDSKRANSSTRALCLAEHRPSPAEHGDLVSGRGRRAPLTVPQIGDPAWRPYFVQRKLRCGRSAVLEAHRYPIVLLSHGSTSVNLSRMAQGISRGTWLHCRSCESSRQHRGLRERRSRRAVWLSGSAQPI